MVKGKLINRNYTDKDGNKKYVTEVEIDDFYMLGKNAEWWVGLLCSKMGRAPSFMFLLK